MSLIPAIKNVAAELRIPAEWLYNVIRMESNFNPFARNAVSGARGLLQFTNKTSRLLGYASADELVSRYPDFLSQLYGPVRAYFSLPSARGPYPSKQSFYMAVFLPSFRASPPSAPFPPAVVNANPGIRSPADYIARADRSGSVTNVFLTVSILTAIGAAWYLSHKGRE